MAGRYDLRIDQGSHFRAVLSAWGTKDPEGVVDGYDLTGASAELHVGGYRYGALPIANDEITISLTGAETESLCLPAEFVVVVTLAGGEVRHALEGRMVGRHRRSHV